MNSFVDCCLFMVDLVEDVVHFVQSTQGCSQLKHLSCEGLTNPGVTHWVGCDQSVEVFSLGGKTTDLTVSDVVQVRSGFDLGFPEVAGQLTGGPEGWFDLVNVCHGGFLIHTSSMTQLPPEVKGKTQYDTTPSSSRTGAPYGQLGQVSINLGTLGEVFGNLTDLVHTPSSQILIKLQSPGKHAVE